MTIPPLFVGLDVGGTTMKAGVVDESGRPIGPPVSLPTEAAKGQHHGLLQMVATIKQAVAGARTRMERIVAVGVATPGSMDIPAGIMVRRYRDLGGRMMFLSAGNFHLRAERQGDSLRRLQPWRRLGRPEAAVVGVQYSASRSGGGGKAYVVQGALDEPWAFTGTGLLNGSSFGRFGAEIDSRATSSPAGTVVLARIPRAIGRHAAEMTFYDTAAGARVFAAGALDFGGSIDLPAAGRLVENVWARLAG